jgi:hypothetical protein
MQILKKGIVFLLALSALFNPCPAQDSVSVYLKVYSYDWSGIPIIGATVTLQKFNISATTDSLGKCSINKRILASLPIIHQSEQPALSAKPELTSNGLCFSIAGSPQQTLISLFTLSGRKVADIVNANLASGDYRINPFSLFKTSQPYIVRARIGNQACMFKAIKCGARSAAGRVTASRLEKNETGHTSSKKAVTYDNIVVSAPHYVSETRPLDSIEGSHYFFLHASGVTGKYLDVMFTFNEIIDPLPSRLTSVWLEDANRTRVQTLFVCSWLSEAGYRLTGICPQWLGPDSSYWATQRSTNMPLVDAVTHPTPISGKNSINLPLTATQNAVRCCIEMHFSAENNILYSADLNLQSDSAEAAGTVTYVPSKMAGVDIDALSEVRFKVHK